MSTQDPLDAICDTLAAANPTWTPLTESAKAAIRANKIELTDEQARTVSRLLKGSPHWRLLLAIPITDEERAAAAALADTSTGSTSHSIAR